MIDYSKLDSTFENKDKMLDIAADELLSRGLCPYVITSKSDAVWKCKSNDEYPAATTCIRCIRLYIKYLAELEDYL